MDKETYKIARDILQNTNDGDDLAPEDLSLVQASVNGNLNEQGAERLQEIHRDVMNGDYANWFHDIEHLTIDHEGHVRWKGTAVEHFELNGFAYSHKGEISAKRVALVCKLLELKGRETSKRNYFDVLNNLKA